MKASVTQPSSWQRVIDIEIPEEEVNESFEQQVKKYKKDLKLPGFRPGKVPSDIVKRRFGPAIRAEVVDELVQKSYRDACAENNLNPISEAKVEKFESNEGQPVRLTIETEVEPEIEITGYDKLKVKVAPRKIKKADVDKALEDLQERLSELKDVDRPSKKGDYLTIEYQKVVLEGEERTDFQNPQHPIELGTSVIKEFDKDLMGKSAGDVVTVSVSFPRDYQSEQLAGKDAEFEIKINKVQEKEIPEINEDFLKKIGDFSDEEALREHLKNDLEKQEQEKARQEAYNKAIEQLIKNNPFEVPNSRIEKYIDYMVEETRRYSQGQEPDRAEIAQKYRETAINSLKRMRIVDYIADREGIKATQTEVDEKIRELAAMYNQDFDQLKQTFRKNGTTMRIRSDIREQKTLDFLIGELETKQE